MCKKRFKSYSLVLISFLVLSVGFKTVKGQQTANLSFSVNVPGNITLVDIEPSSAEKTITFNLVAPVEAGVGINETTLTNNTLWMNYTCSKGDRDRRKKISVQMDNSNSLPSGIELKLLAGSCSCSAGKGTFGSSSGQQLTLSSAPQTLISGIGGSYTGNGSSFGHNLTYSLVIADYSLLYSVTNADVRISFIISEQ